MPYARIDAKTEEEFVSKARTLLATNIRFFTQNHDRCVLGLSGGSTPKAIYATLWREKDIDWEKVWVFLVDDRHVPDTNPDSNQHLLHETLLKYAPIPAAQVILPHTNMPIAECVKNYDERLSELLGDDSPDVVVLGIGDDGHIASLFPPLLNEAFSDQHAIHTTTDRFAVHDRISVTLPVLVRSKIPVFFLKGEEKRAVWNDMIASKEDYERWPAQAVLADGRAFAVIG